MRGLSFALLLVLHTLKGFAAEPPAQGPTPRDWSRSSGNPEEDWTLDEWFGEQEFGCWVLREAEDSLPMQESFLLLPAAEQSSRPVHLMCVFTETPPDRLIRELEAAFGLASDTVQVSDEDLQELNMMYQQLLEFSSKPEL